MIDTAQLREALADYNIEGALVGDDVFDVVFAAARELLTIREAGALIITPDEATVERIARVIDAGHWNVKTSVDGPPGSREEQIARRVLDALRDAMPDGQEVAE